MSEDSRSHDDPGASAASTHPSAQSEERLLADCEVRRQRRSGPGGQHRNKVETGVVLVHRPSGVRAEATERRSQAENRAVAIQRLRVLLALHVRTDPLPGPSDLWRSRLRGGRIEVATSHIDFPTLLAEALDVLFSQELAIAESARRLGCSSSQMVRLMEREPRALAFVNAERQRRGLRPLA